MTYQLTHLGMAVTHSFMAGHPTTAVPSLLSIPLLGWSKYDKKVYEATRQRLLSPKNSQYFQGPELKGIGSPHTPNGYVWPIALAGEHASKHGKVPRATEQPLPTACLACFASICFSALADRCCPFPCYAVQALTTKDVAEQAYVLRTMLKLQCGNGLMHESVSTQNLDECTRPVFEWANAMLVSVHSCAGLTLGNGSALGNLEHGAPTH